MRRGEKSVRDFAEAMIETLNTEDNAKKSHWSGMTLGQLKEKLAEEVGEVLTEIEIIESGGDPDGLILETTDLANVCMMLRERAIEILIRITAQGGRG